MTALQKYLTVEARQLYRVKKRLVFDFSVNLGIA